MRRSSCWTSISFRWSLWTSSFSCPVLQQWCGAKGKKIMQRKWMVIGFWALKTTRTTHELSRVASMPASFYCSLTTMSFSKCWGDLQKPSLPCCWKWTWTGLHTCLERCMEFPWPSTARRWPAVRWASSMCRGPGDQSPTSWIRKDIWRCFESPPGMVAAAGNMCLPKQLQALNTGQAGHQKGPDWKTVNSWRSRITFASWMRSGLVRCDQIHSASFKWMFEDGGAPPAASISLCHRAGFGIESLFGDEGAGLSEAAKAWLLQRLRVNL